MSDSRHLMLDDMASSEVWIRVALDVPLDGPFDYRCTQEVVVGDRVIVSFGRRKMIGLVVGLPSMTRVTNSPLAIELFQPVQSTAFPGANTGEPVPPVPV